MKKIGVILLTGFSILLAPGVRAQSEDPSEVFLKAYMTSQQGEKLEHDNNFRDALAKFRFAGSLLEELRKRHAEWQPAIVEYRSRKIGESILRVEAKVGTQKDLNASAPAVGREHFIAGPAGKGRSGAAKCGTRAFASGTKSRRHSSIAIERCRDSGSDKAIAQQRRGLGSAITKISR